MTNQVWETTGENWIPASFLDDTPTATPSEENRYDVEIEHVRAPVMHPITGEAITHYKRLVKDPVTKRGIVNGFWKTIWKNGPGPRVILKERLKVQNLCL